MPYRTVGDKHPQIRYSEDGSLLDAWTFRDVKKCRTGPPSGGSFPFYDPPMSRPKWDEPVIKPVVNDQQTIVDTITGELDRHGGIRAEHNLLTPEFVRKAPKRYATRPAEMLAAARREKFLELVVNGWQYDAAAREVGWVSGAKYLLNVQKKHPDWWSQVQYARQRFKELSGKAGHYQDRQLPFGEFVAKWFPDRRPHLPHQLRIADILDSLEPRDVVMVLIWPEAGKTATLEDYICKTLAHKPDHRFSYVSEASDLAKRVLGTCARRFTNEDDYGPFIARYGPFYVKGQERQGRPWTTEALMLATNPGTERDRNLVARSWTSAVYGSRIDTLVIDDVQSQRNYNQAEEIARRIRGTFFNRGKELKTLIIGTRIGPGDFYERFLDAGLVTRQIVLPAVKPDGEPTVPEFWESTLVHNGGACCAAGSLRVCPKNGASLTPREFMELLEFQSGPETWHASYLQNPRSDTRSTFAEYIDRCLDRDRNVGPLTPEFA